MFIFSANDISFQTVKGILRQYRLCHNDDVPIIKPEKLLNIIHDIYFAGQKIGNVSLCFNCFSANYSDRKHPSTHKMVEVYYKVSLFSMLFSICVMSLLARRWSE